MRFAYFLLLLGATKQVELETGKSCVCSFYNFLKIQ